MRVSVSLRWIRLLMPCVAAAVMLSACGGGGDGGADEVPPPPPTPLPTALVVSAPTTSAQQVGESVGFSQNATDPDNKLVYAWSFGDGASSAVSAPTHTYEHPGTYQVALTVTNEKGETRQATLEVVVADVALVQGLLCSGAEQTGWCWQQPVPQGDLVSSFHFIDTRTAYAVGDLGAALKTVDGGVTWQKLNTGTDVPLQRVLFLDAQVGVATGANGLLLRTSDAGASWAATQLPLSVDGGPIRSLGGNTLWLGSNLLRDSLISNDAGASWAPYNEAAAIDGSCASGGAEVVSAVEVWCLREDYYYAEAPVQHSVDAGKTWKVLSLPALEPGMWRYMRSWDAAGSGFVVVLVMESGYVNDSAYVSRQRLYRTSDAGASWQVSEVGVDGQPSYGVSFSDARHGLLSCSAYDFSCDNLKTNDGGAHWFPVSRPATQTGDNNYEMRLSGPSLLVARYSSGVAKLSADNGLHWTDFVATGSGAALGGVWFFNAREGIATGAYEGTVRRTTDGGKTWTKRELPSAGVLGALQFTADGGVGWIAGNDGQLYRTNDRGASWVLPLDQFNGLTTPRIAGFHFIDNSRGWLVSDYGVNSTNMYRSNDAGSTWTAVPGVQQALVSVHFGDAMHGVAVGYYGQALVTADGGETWTARPTGTAANLRKVRFIDASTVVALGEYGVILRSVDGGQNWSKSGVASSGDLVDLHFVDAQLGFAVGQRGTVLRTQDGGKTWLPLPAPTAQSLSGVFFVDAETGWVVGENGTIMVTAFGGD